MSGLLVKLKVCEKYLLTKVSETIQVNFTKLENRPIINLQINNIYFSATLDTGSSFTIIPDKHFQQLKIPESKLNTEKNYSIQSASQIISNAVKVTLTLSVKIKNSDDSYQYINQMFLVLREKLSLPTILLGNDFLSVSNSQIIYHKDKPVSLFINEQNVNCCQGMQDNSYFTECLKSNVPTLGTPVPTLATPVPTLVTHPPTLATPPSPQSENVHIEPTKIMKIYPPPPNMKKKF